MKEDIIDLQEQDLAETNPVYFYQKYRERYRLTDIRRLQYKLAKWIRDVQANGVRFPRKIWEDEFSLIDAPEWLGPPERPGVVGLLVATNQHASGTMASFATRIRAAEVDNRTKWITRNVPFRGFEVQDILNSLIEAFGFERSHGAIPETRSFDIQGTFKGDLVGSSITLSGALAVIDLINKDRQGKPEDIFRCCCSLLMPRKNKLVPVGEVTEKLVAFRREYMRGSLVIANEDLKNFHQLDRMFDQVWIVNNLQDLANYLEQYGLMQPLLKQSGITIAQVHAARLILEEYKDFDGNPKRQVAFAERLKAALDCSSSVSFKVRFEILEILQDVFRHAGSSQLATYYSLESFDSMNKAGDDFSFFQRAMVANRLASAYYDAHDFKRGIVILRSFVQEAIETPKLIPAEERAWLFNTLGRLLSAVGDQGWKELFELSIDLQSRVNPQSIPRTRIYYTHALLKANQLVPAARQIDLLQKDALDEYSAKYSLFLQADYRRRACQKLDARIFAEESAKIAEIKAPKHLEAFYLQATAREAGLDHQLRLERLERAVKLLFEESLDEGNILHLFGLFLKLSLDNAERESVFRQISESLDRDSTQAMKAWYSDALAQFEADPELLYNRVPYF